MDTLLPLSDHHHTAVERSFAAADRERALQLLGTVESEYMRSVIVAMADGDLAKLAELVTKCSEDSRDVLILLSPWHGNCDIDLVARWQRLGIPIPDHMAAHLPEVIDRNIRVFLGRRLLFPSDALQATLRLREDLGADGLAGQQLIEDFGREFQVNLDGFHPEQHFELPRRGDLMRGLFRRLTGACTPIRIPITIADLVAAVQAKKLASASLSRAPDQSSS